MAEGIEFLLEMNAKFDEMLGLNREMVKFIQTIEKGDKAVKKHTHELGLFGKALEHVTERVKEFGKEALATFTGIASFEGMKEIGEKVLDLGKDLLMGAANAQKTDRAFGALFGGEAAEGMLAWAEKFAKSTEFSGEYVKSAAQRLKAIGLSERDIVESIAGAADIAGRTGSGMEGFDRAIGAIEMINTSRHAPARGLGAMGFGQGAGKNIEKNLHRGMTAAQAFNNELRKAEGTDKLGGFAVSRGKDFDVKAKKLSELPERFGAALSKSEGFGQLSEGLTKALSALDPDSPSGKRIIAGLDQMLGKIGAFVSTVDFDKVTQDLVKAFEVLPPAIEVTTTTLRGLVWEMSKLVDLIGDVKRSAGGGDADGGFSAKKPTRSAANFLVAAAKGTLGSITGLGSDGVTFGLHYVSSLFESQGGNAAKGMAKGMMSASPAVSSAATDLAMSSVDAVSGTLETHSPSRVFEKLGKFTAQGFGIGLESGADGVRASAGAVFSPETMYSPAKPSGMGGAPITMNADIQINVGGGTGSPQETADAAAVSVRQAIQSAFEQFRAEVGA